MCGLERDTINKNAGFKSSFYQQEKLPPVVIPSKCRVFLSSSICETWTNEYAHKTAECLGICQVPGSLRGHMPYLCYLTATSWHGSYFLSSTWQEPSLVDCHCTPTYMSIILAVLMVISWGRWNYCLHFTAKDAENWKGRETCPSVCAE